MGGSLALCDSGWVLGILILDGGFSAWMAASPAHDTIWTLDHFGA